MVKSIKTFQALLSCSYDAKFNGLNLTEMVGCIEKYIAYSQLTLRLIARKSFTDNDDNYSRKSNEKGIRNLRYVGRDT